VLGEVAMRCPLSWVEAALDDRSGFFYSGFVHGFCERNGYTNIESGRLVCYGLRVFLQLLQTVLACLGIAATVRQNTLSRLHELVLAPPSLQETAIVAVRCCCPGDDDSQSMVQSRIGGEEVCVNGVRVWRVCASRPD
jgi:hypothetical protein